MNQKTKRIIAVIALVFVLIFTVFFILYLFDRNMGDGWIGAITLITFIVGGGLSGFIIVVNNRDKKTEQERKEIEKDLKEAETEESIVNQEEIPRDKK